MNVLMAKFTARGEEGKGEEGNSEEESKVRKQMCLLVHNEYLDAEHKTLEQLLDKFLFPKVSRCVDRACASLTLKSKLNI